MNFFLNLKKWKPCEIRLMARWPDGRAMQNREIAKLSGLTLQAVVSISAGKSPDDWDAIPLSHVEAFLKGCQITSFSMARKYWKRTFLTRQKPLAHLDTLPRKQRARIARLLR